MPIQSPVLPKFRSGIFPRTEIESCRRKRKEGQNKKSFPGICYIQKQKKGGASRKTPPPEFGADLLSRPSGSTIGAGGLNFSVRDGKRWVPAAIGAFSFPADRQTDGRPVRFDTLRDARRKPLRTFRAISTARLCRRRLCTCGLSTSSSATALKGGLVSGRASRLDAFSAYPIRAWIPGGATGVTTGKPEARPSRSSRTSDGSPQSSNARDR